MDKKKGMILGGVGLVVVILLIFLLSGNSKSSDGLNSIENESSTKNMLIGKWEHDVGDLIEFRADGTLKDDSPPSRSKTWSLSDDETTLAIHQFKVDRESKRVDKSSGKTKFYTLISISDDELCVRNEQSKERCYSRVSD